MLQPCLRTTLTIYLCLRLCSCWVGGEIQTIWEVGWKGCWELSLMASFQASGKRGDVNFLIMFRAWLNRSWRPTQPCFVTLKLEPSKQLSVWGVTDVSSAGCKDSNLLLFPSSKLPCASMLFFLVSQQRGREMEGLRRNNKAWYVDSNFQYIKCFTYFISGDPQLNFL